MRASSTKSIWGCRLMLLFIALLLSIKTLSAQSFWTEDFGSGCDQNNQADGFLSINGTWTLTNTGSNDSVAQSWYISATEPGMGLGYCRGTGCNFIPGDTNRTLHIGNINNINSMCPLGDCGATYDAGGMENTTTNRRIESPTINCTGHSNITLSFLYIENGHSIIDNATVWYFDGIAWTQIGDPPKTDTSICMPVYSIWLLYSVLLPASANNNPSVRIGFNWTNNNDGIGTDPSVAIDDISLGLGSAQIDENNTSQTEIFIYPNPAASSIHIETHISGKYNISIFNVDGILVQKIDEILDNQTIDISSLSTGLYIFSIESKTDIYHTKFVKE